MVEKIILLVSEDGKSNVKIDNGELISYSKDGEEYIHQKENLGWNSSDTEMFPIIGPTVKNNYTVATLKGDAVLDQHGLLREFEYQLLKKEQQKALFFKEYKKNTLLKNRKYPNTSPKEVVFWSYDFYFEKKIKLTNDALEIVFEINSEKGMPFMFGYHPAFKLSGLETEIIETPKEQVGLNKIMAVGANAYPLLNCSELVLHNSNKKNVKVTTKGFNNFMLWTAVSNMLCIEPITQFPSLKDHKYSNKNMRISCGNDVFSVIINIL